MQNPFLLIIIGFVLVVAAAVLSWLIFLHILPSTYLLDFFTFGMSVLGLFLGLVGAALYVRLNKKKKP